MALTRKKVRVKAKSGKTYTRNMMVRSGDKQKRGLAAMNPWSPSHTEHVPTANNQLGGVAKYYGSAGPGSTHSALAWLAGHHTARRRAEMDGSWSHRDTISAANDVAAQLRREAGVAGSNAAIYSHTRTASSAINRALQSEGRLFYPGARNQYLNNRVQDISRAFGGQVAHVHNNPKKWVR